MSQLLAFLLFFITNELSQGVSQEAKQSNEGLSESISQIEKHKIGAREQYEGRIEAHWIGMTSNSTEIEVNVPKVGVEKDHNQKLGDRGLHSLSLSRKKDPKKCWCCCRHEGNGVTVCKTVEGNPPRGFRVLEKRELYDVDGGNSQKLEGRELGKLLSFSFASRKKTSNGTPGGEVGEGAQLSPNRRSMNRGKSVSRNAEQLKTGSEVTLPTEPSSPIRYPSRKVGKSIQEASDEVPNSPKVKPEAQGNTDGPRVLDKMERVTNADNDESQTLKGRGGLVKYLSSRFSMKKGSKKTPNREWGSFGSSSNSSPPAGYPTREAKENIEGSVPPSSQKPSRDASVLNADGRSRNYGNQEKPRRPRRSRTRCKHRGGDCTNCRRSFEQFCRGMLCCWLCEGCCDACAGCDPGACDPGACCG